MTHVTNGPTEPGWFGPLLDRIESAGVLDGPARAIGSTVRWVTSPRAVKNALSGTWLGHAVHPLLTDVVVGSFVSATLLDLIGGDGGGTARERLIAVGLAAYPPTALTGGTDWSEVEQGNDAVRRAGLAHAVANAGALTLYGASLAARRKGRQRRGVLLGLAGAGALGVGAFLGGHLSFAKGVGVDDLGLPSQSSSLAG